jgi:LysM repeat protein
MSIPLGVIMAQKRWPAILLGALPVLAMGLSNQYLVSNQDIKGSETIKIAPHTSKWNYPKEVVIEAGQELHIVKKGDTLWDLGQKYLGSPHAWPQIWELNKWVRDPHWIYPGNPLLIPADRSVFGHDGLAPHPDKLVADLPPDLHLIRIPSPSSRIGYAYAFQDFLRLPYLVPQGAKAHFKELGAIKITGCQKEIRSLLSKGDVVYLGGGQNKGLHPGDRMLVLKIVKTKLIHPDNKLGLKPIGDVVKHAAVLRVLAIHAKNAEAVIEDTIDGVDIGDYAAAFAEQALIHSKDAPLKKDTLEPIPVNTSAKIIYGGNNAVHFSVGSLVLIDRGSNVGFKTGDVLLAVREKPLEGEGLYSRGKKSNPHTNRYLGQMLIVRTEGHSSTCLILASKSEIALGDIVTN